MADLISRAVALQCVKESRDNIDWGQSDDGDAFMHYTGALYRTMASSECVRAVDAIPVEWLEAKRERMASAGQDTAEQAIAYVLWLWRKEANEDA